MGAELSRREITKIQNVHRPLRWARNKWFENVGLHTERCLHKHMLLLNRRDRHVVHVQGDLCFKLTVRHCLPCIDKHELVSKLYTNAGTCKFRHFCRQNQHYILVGRVQDQTFDHWISSAVLHHCIKSTHTS